VTSLWGTDVITFIPETKSTINGNIIDPAKNYVSFLTEGTSQGTAWFFASGVPPAGKPNKFGEYRGKACLSPKNVPICRGPSVPYLIQSMTAGGDGNLWFAEQSALAVGVVNVNKPKHAPSVLNLPRSLTGSIESLVPGPGKTMYALVYGDSTTTVVTLAPGPSLTKTVSTQSIPSGIDIAGYSPVDGNLYVVDDSSGAIWSIAPGSGTTTQILSSPGLKSGDPDNRPMTLLKDGSLAYIGFSSVDAENEIGHIVPGRKPYPVSFVVPVQGSASGGLNGVWSIEYQGSDLEITSTNGGNILTAIW
jgi:hypothetical protein